MYKVKDAADQLGVTRVEIFEILLSQRELFDPFVIKKNSITYISDEGIALLESVIKANSSQAETIATAASEPIMEVETVNLVETIDVVLATEEDHNETTADRIVQEDPSVPPISIGLTESNIYTETIHETEVQVESLSGELLEFEDDLEDYDHSQMNDEDLERISDDFFSTIQDNPSVSKIESEDLLVGQWLKEIQTEDEQAIQLDVRLKEIRGQVTGLRNKILVLDSEIKRKDEAIKHYHEIMKDDLRWLEDMERKVQLIVKNQLAQYEAEENTESIAESIAEDDKGNFFKFFKR